MAPASEKTHKHSGGKALIPLSREFSRFISPHETRIFNTTRWYTGDGSAASHAVDFMVNLFHTWQAAKGRMTGEGVYRALWDYLREMPSKCEACSSTDIACSLRELPPEERMLILLKDALGLDYGPIGSIMEIEKPDLPSAINNARRHLVGIHLLRTRGER